MRRPNILIAAVALVLGLVASPVTAQALPACSISGTQAVPGGYAVHLDCQSGGYFRGVGTTLNDANSAVYALQQYAANTGVVCRADDPVAATGGYEARLDCRSSGYYRAVGTSVTSAATQAFDFRTLAATTGIVCSSTAPTTATGGYLAYLDCAKSGFYRAVGTYLTDAETEVVALLTLTRQTGKVCRHSSTDTVTGGYQVTLDCAKAGFFRGVGSTVTDASRQARALAG
ncbi:hypothetical protein [Actinokineospora globicatena]|uniref:hypothetical protein n=1 Tax=Actinokineospora globicatena TaxID=103729 RepID=UPI0020A5E185|nr:hypothetical protein [Actinokineospora globicatena]MCP2305995.1 hypothetical protein [Actinokineospora globicatena]